MPRDLPLTSLIPANSQTARTAPPAITPVPTPAGFNKTLPAPNSPTTSCGIVVFIIGTLITCF